MADDPKLIEAVARAMHPIGWQTPICRCGKCLAMYEEDRVEAMELAELALAAVNASGTHWVAPVEANYRMRLAIEIKTGKPAGECGPVWDAARLAAPAYLAKTETGK